MRHISCLRGFSSMAILWAATAVVSAGQGGTNDTPRQQAPRVLVDSLAGVDSFDLYCAPCHGSDARGNGPVAPALKTAPPDLTQLARRNGGAFPADRVRAYVTGTGRTLPAHGPAEMPVWGPVFSQLDEAFVQLKNRDLPDRRRSRSGAFETDVRVRERIKNLVQYLATVQR